MGSKILGISKALFDILDTKDTMLVLMVYTGLDLKPSGQVVTVCSLVIIQGIAITTASIH